MKRSLALAATAAVTVITICLLATHEIRTVHGQQQAATMQLQNDGPTFGSAKVAAAGVLPIYNPDGTSITNGRCVQAIVTSAATTGQFSMSYTALGFTTITSYRAQAQSPSASLILLGNMYTANVVSVSTTQITGTVTSPTSVAALGGFAVGFGPSATQVSVGVCGS